MQGATAGCGTYAGGRSAVNCLVWGGATDGGDAWTAAAAALASSPAVANRSPGLFAMPFATTASNAGLRPGRTSLGRGGGANMCALMTCRMSAASNGARPVRHSNSRHVSEYTSDGGPPGVPPSRSLAMYAHDPMIIPVLVTVASPPPLAMPKSTR